MNIFHQTIILSFAFVLFSQKAYSMDHTIQLSLLNNVQVVKNIVMVKDVVNVENGLSDELASLVLTKAPLPGYSKSVSRKYINKMIKNSKFENSKRVTVVGSSYIKIERSSRKISTDVYQQKAKSFLSKYLSAKYLSVELEIVGDNKALLVPDSIINFSFSSNNDLSLKHRMCVMTEVISDGEFHSKIPVWFKVKAKQKVYVSKSNIAANQQLKSGKLKTVIVNALGVKGQPIVTVKEFKKLVASNEIQAGQVITRNLLAMKSDVFNGANVDVVVTVGNVTLHTKAVAKQSGVIGDIVELYNMKNKEIFKGIIINENYVRSL